MTAATGFVSAILPTRADASNALRLPMCTNDDGPPACRSISYVLAEDVSLTHTATTPDRSVKIR
jgi:hypothetical protein